MVEGIFVILYKQFLTFSIGNFSHLVEAVSVI